MTTQDPWTVEKAAETYGIHGWSNNYFEISEVGEVTVKLPHGDTTQSIALMDIITGLHERGMGSPVLLRFRDIIAARITRIHTCFRAAMKRYHYTGTYRGVFPIKVNQQQQVIEEISRVGAGFHHGLEAGSKAELMIALAYLQDEQSLLICNGYKDEEFIDLALWGQRLGMNVVLVIEMLGELELIIKRAQLMGIKPVLGLRAKLSSRASGKWNDSGGDRSVFGLSAHDMIQVVDRLREVDMLGCLHMLHFHLGSQIPNITDIRTAVAEAARVYIDLAREGATLGILDIGGGLAVDYDGSHSNFSCSRNYGLDEYASDIIETLLPLLEDANIQHPDIVSESGRALVAHSSVLVFDILDATRFECHDAPSLDKSDKNLPQSLVDLYDVYTELSPRRLQEFYNDALYYRDQLRSDFNHGMVSLRQRALGEQFFWATLTRIQTELLKLDRVPEDLKEFSAQLGDIYYGNFSVFQSLPDHWAIEQVFPVMPLHRLNEEPTRLVTLSDITCDCDGVIDRFIDQHDVARSLPLHTLHPDKPYMLGVFLVGAYQETLGDLHNLFGDTNIAAVHLDEDGSLDYTNEVQGDTVADVVSYVEYEPKELAARIRVKAETAVRKKVFSASDRRTLIEAYAHSLRGYTYFEREL